MRFEKLPMRALSAGSMALTNSSAAFSTSPKFAPHAAAAIEQHHDRDRLDVVGEERQLLPLAVVEDREQVASEIRDEPAVGARDRGIDRDGPVGALEGRLLTGGERRENEHEDRNDALHCPLPGVRFSYAGCAGFGGSAFMRVVTSWIARCSCGSVPFASCAGSSSTGMSGSTPWPSANHCPFGSYIRNVGTVTPPPSTSAGAPLMPISPPHVRVPMSGPRPACAEVERKRVAARSAPAVDQHHLRPAVRDRRPLLRRRVAHRPVGDDRPVQQLDEAIGNLAAAVPPLVDDQPVLLPLRHELPHQLVLRVGAGALHVDVADLAAGRLVHDLPPLLDPRAEPQLDLVVQARDDHLTRVRSVDGVRVDREHDGLLARAPGSSPTDPPSGSSGTPLTAST